MLNEKPPENPAGLFLLGAHGEAVASAVMHYTVMLGVPPDFSFLFTHPSVLNRHLLNQLLAPYFLFSFLHTRGSSHTSHHAGFIPEM